jgi:hypothetical protein
MRGRNASGQQFKGQVPLTYPLRPGDTVVVKERRFRGDTRNLL